MLKVPKTSHFHVRSRLGYLGDFSGQDIFGEAPHLVAKFDERVASAQVGADASDPSTLLRVVREVVLDVPDYFLDRMYWQTGISV